MMSLPRIGVLVGLLLVLSSAPALAQPSADAFFHDAAQAYVEGDLAGARRAVRRGLKVAPSDPRLQALREKLERQTKQQGGGASSRQSGGDPSRDRPSRGKPSRQQRSGEAGEKSRSQGKRSSGQRSSRSSEAAKAPSESGAQRRGSEGGKTARRPHALSRAQAARLLRALERQEMKLLREVQTRGQPSTTVKKDW